jgi:hypothetical protein
VPSSSSSFVDCRKSHVAAGPSERLGLQDRPLAISPKLKTLLSSSRVRSSSVEKTRFRLIKGGRSNPQKISFNAYSPIVNPKFTLYIKDLYIMYLGAAATRNMLPVHKRRWKPRNGSNVNVLMCLLAGFEVSWHELKKLGLDWILSIILEQKETSENVSA